MKQLFIISKESRAARFGIGTYIRQLIECFDLSLWCIHVVELNASVEGYVYKEKAIYYENYFALLVAQRLELNYLLTLDFAHMD